MSRAMKPRAKMPAMKTRTPARRRNPEYDEDAYRRALAGDKRLKGANLRGAYLLGANLRGANLEGANIDDAVLDSANLDGADLTGASLKNASLEDVRMSEANLTGADLERVNLTGANLLGANLLGANLEGANLEDAILERAYLFGAILDRGWLPRANITFTNLVRANLEGANLEGANLEGANLERADLRRANLRKANLESANLAGANLGRANLFDANLEGANLEDANLRSAYLLGANLLGANLAYASFAGANLRNANLSRANLEYALLHDANLRNANLEGANLQGANLEDANIEGTILDAPPPNRPSRSFGRQTGSVLKMGKPDAPSRAVDFKKKYPAEFERLKGDTGGRDFSEPLRAQVRQKYETPFVWLVTDGTYDNEAQRLCPDPNLVLKFNIDPRDPGFTERQREFLTKLAETSRRSGHPHEKRLFTVGWVRVCVNEAAETWLVEEVQSDVGVVREKLKDGSAPPGLEEYADVIEGMRPYLDRFYEDALGVVFMEAEKRGYAVEMLTYETKKPMGSPRSVYTDLPRSMGMQKQPTSKVLRPEVLFSQPVWYYKPNPRSSPRSSSSRSSRSSSRPSRGARSTRKPKGRR